MVALPNRLNFEAKFKRRVTKLLFHCCGFGVALN